MSERFETGFGAPDDARVVFAEVWPSWWKVCPRLGPPNDKAQVRTVARLFAGGRATAGESPFQYPREAAKRAICTYSRSNPARNSWATESPA